MHGWVDVCFVSLFLMFFPTCIYKGDDPFFLSFTYLSWVLVFHPHDALSFSYIVTIIIIEQPKQKRCSFVCPCND
jgi:hypothetical protein